MSQREVSITGNNNTRVKVTGQEELLVKVNSIQLGTNDPVTSTTVGPDTGLDVNIIGGLTLSVDLDALDDQVGIYGYTDINDPTSVKAISVTSTGEVNIRPLDCTTDSVAICDGAGNALVIDSNGSINSNLYAIDSANGLPASVTLTGLGTSNALDVFIQGPKGVQADCADAISTALCQTQEDILTDIKTAVEGTVDVNIVSGVTLEVNLDKDNDTVQVYGSDTTAPIATDAAGHLQVDVLTTPGTFAEDTAHISGDTGTFVLAVRNDNNIIMTSNDGDYSPIAVNKEGAVAIHDGGGSISVNGAVTVSATALDIRALTCTDKVTLCSDGLSVGLTGTQLPVGLYADDLVSGAPERLTTTGSTTYQALDVNQVSFVRTPNLKVYTTGTGFIAVPVYSITFFNSGSDNELITFDGGSTYETIPAGFSISMDAGGNNTYAASVFGYDIIGSGPLIITYNS